MNVMSAMETDPKSVVADYISKQQKKNTVYESKQSVTSLTNEFMSKKKLTISGFAETLGVSRSMLSLYLNGKYTSDPTELEGKIMEHLKEAGFIKENAEEKQSLRMPTFYRSSDSIEVLGACQSCQEYGALGVVVGKSGYGKTYSLRQFSRVGRVCYIECDDSMTSKDLIDALEKAIGLPSGLVSIWKRTENLKDFFNVNKGYLLIIDEADKLISKNTQKKIEILRAIFDQSNVGMILAGEPALEAKLKSYLPRLANRVDFYTNLHGINRKEVAELLQPYNFTSEALEEMYRRAANVQTGCFRLLDRTLKNVLRIAGTDDVITLDVIDKASSMMML